MPASYNIIIIALYVHIKYICISDELTKPVFQVSLRHIEISKHYSNNPQFDLRDKDLCEAKSSFAK